jgi:hypothetical protein
VKTEINLHFCESLLQDYHRSEFEPAGTFEIVEEHTELLRRMQWHPIETAPKDGTVVDLWCITEWTGHAFIKRDCAWKVHDWSNGEPANPPNWFTIRQNRGEEGPLPIPISWMLPFRVEPPE